MKLEKWRLGLDLGTNSIGWSVFSLDDENHPLELIDLGVRIFSDGRNPKTNEPLNNERRTARGQRRSIHRRKIRRKATFRLLQAEGLFPAGSDECKALKLLDPYKLRVEALDRKLEPNELGRVLFNLSVRRGFKSNRKDGNNEVTSDKESKSSKITQSQMQTELQKAINDSGSRTLGEYLLTHSKENKGIRFVPGRTTYYPTRQMYLDEFNTIRAKQELYFSDIDWDGISAAIFDQRPLRPQERGKCQYMPENERTFKAMPCAQRIRILQDIRNLKYTDEYGKVLPITDEEDEKLITLLNSKSSVTFEEMKKALKLNFYGSFNLESSSRSSLKGNDTAVKMRSKNRFGAMWDSFSLEEQDSIVEVLITAEEDSEVRKMLEKYDLSDEQKTYITKLVLPTGTTMLCKEVTEKLVDKMEKLGTAGTYVVAVQTLGYKYAEQSIEKRNLLPYYGEILTGSTMSVRKSDNTNPDELKYGKISNPTVHVALNQTRVVVNALIKEYGKPTQIAVELSRELKSSRERKAQDIKKQNENTKRNEIINKNIQDAYNIQFPKREDRLKYRLWEELGEDSLSRKCLYCGKVISGQELFTKNIEIEHILPYSRTLLDSETNLTVAHSSCNAFKAERSPYEAFNSNPPGYDWSEILLRSNMLHEKKKKRRFDENAMEVFEKDSGFIARQLTDNAYLSRIALRYLKCLTASPSEVWAVNGGMTKLLRDKWEIDYILKRKITPTVISHFNISEDKIDAYQKPKNRLDHRHHALDAVVIALTDRSLVQEISSLNAKGKKNRIELPSLPVIRPELDDKVKNIVVSFKPDHGPEGKLSKETLLGKIKREESIPVAKLTEEDIPLIKAQKVRSDFENELKAKGDFKLVVKAMKDVYPVVKIYREAYVARTSVTSLKEKDIPDVVDYKIRQKLLDFVALHKGEKFENIMTQFVEKEWNGKPVNGNGKTYTIKKVRCYNRVQTPIEIKGDIDRYLAPDDYFAAVVWQIPPKKAEGKPSYQAQFIRRDQIGKDNKPKPSVLSAPHPAAKKLGTVHKDDYLEITVEQQRYLCRVAGYSATQNKFDIRPICAVNDCFDWIVSTQEMMLEHCWKPQKGHNFVSVNVLFGEKQASFVTVNPIGKVFRK